MSEPVLARQDLEVIQGLGRQLPHALLLTAEPGLDIERTAARIARSEPSEVTIISPEEKKTTISVSQVRDYIASTRTYATKRRVLVIRPANLMTEEAQNALLKTLEEPQQGLSIILEASSVDQLLPTIVSRCQVVSLHRTNALQDQTLLKSASIDEQAKQQILFLAAGRPALIRQMVDQPALFESYRQTATDAKQIISGSSYKSLVSAMNYSKDRQLALRLIDVLLSMVRFRIKGNGLDSVAELLIERTVQAERSLKSNGNVKLALLTIAVR